MLPRAYSLSNGGVPQRSLLGSHVFLIHVLDFSAGLPSELFMFADDAQLLSILENSSKIQMICLFFPNGRVPISYLSTWTNVIISFLARASPVPYCCLLLMNFNNQKVSLILGSSSATIFHGRNNFVLAATKLRKHFISRGEMSLPPTQSNRS